MKKRLVPSKAYLDVNEKKKQIARELAVIEKQKVTLPELDRRIMNIPKLNLVLKEDSIKRLKFKK